MNLSVFLDGNTNVSGLESAVARFARTLVSECDELTTNSSDAFGFSLPAGAVCSRGMGLPLLVTP